MKQKYRYINKSKSHLAISVKTTGRAAKQTFFLHTKSTPPPLVSNRNGVCRYGILYGIPQRGYRPIFFSNVSTRFRKPFTISPNLLIFRNSVSNSSHCRRMSFRVSISTVARSTTWLDRRWVACVDVRVCSLSACTRAVIAAISPSKCMLSAVSALESRDSPPAFDELGEDVAGEIPRERWVWRRNWRSEGEMFCMW